MGGPRARHEGQGQHIRAGSRANITLVDPAERRTVDPQQQWTRSTNCPYTGMELPGRVRYTILAGAITVDDAAPVAKEDR